MDKVRTNRPRVVFWLDKPMQVYSPILRALQCSELLELRVNFTQPAESHLLKADGEIGASAVWSDALLKGYRYNCVGSRFRDGFQSALKEAGDGQNWLA